MTPRTPIVIALAVAATSVAVLAQDPPLTILRARTVLDGRGGVIRDAAIAKCPKTSPRSWRRLGAVVPLHLLVASLVCWLEREQHEVIQYLREDLKSTQAPQSLVGQRVWSCSRCPWA